MRNRMVIGVLLVLRSEALLRRVAMLVACSCLLAPEARANNIEVSNIDLTGLNVANSNMLVELDLSWENSWKVGDRRDAAWVFVKYKPAGSNEWYHATLSTNDSDHQAASGGTHDTPSDGKGTFVYRSSDGTGNVNYANIGLRWDYGADGQSFQKGDPIEVSVFAIEMVYVPEGSFYLGSGGAEVAPFYKYPTVTAPYLVTNEAAITVGPATGNLYYATDGDGGDQSGPIPASFPKGFQAFYCMKAEISQGQYAGFLNKLTATQDGTRYSSSFGSNRYRITAPTTNHVAEVPDRACNFLSWEDGAAYADWAALRPMTELEYEKACRGPEFPVANEFAWGSNTIFGSAYTFTNDGLPNAKVTNGGGAGNANYSSTDPNGPLRCGIFAASFGASPSRAEAGATYYGIMEMSGSVCERCVTVGHTTGRTFTGAHGDGVLTAAGEATTASLNWPPAGTAAGAGFRGGQYAYNSNYARVSDRNLAAKPITGRYHDRGWRAVRSAP